MKKVIAVLILLPLLSWSVWQYFSQSMTMEEEFVEEMNSPSIIAPPEKHAAISKRETSTPKRLQQSEEKLARLEEKYMLRLEALARLLETHNLQDLSIGDDMPHDLPKDVQDAWKSYLSALTQLEKLKVEQHEIEEDFIQMAHRGMSLALGLVTK